MPDKKTGAIVVGAAAAVAGLLALAMAKKPEVPPPEIPPEGEPGADLTIEVYDAAGKLVPHNSPVTLAEGETYRAVPRLRNRSVKRTAAGDTPIAATFGIGMVVNIGSFYPPGLGGIGQNYKLVSFAADETKSIADFPTFTVPTTAGGQTGLIYVEVYAPTGEFLKSAQEPIAVAVSAIIYDVDITFV